jgi:hypothetical protein
MKGIDHVKATTAIGVILLLALLASYAIMSSRGRSYMPSAAVFRSMTEDERNTMFKPIAHYDPVLAWNYLKSVALENGEQVVPVHELAHMVGDELYLQKGFEGIRACDDSFEYGCYHGVMEKFLADKGPSQIGTAVTLCKEAYPDDTQLRQYGACIHGLGHGLLTWYSLDLKKALHGCDQVPSDVRLQCADGVFMEYSFDITPDHYPISDPWSLCTAVGQEYYIPCARYQPEIMLNTLHYSPAEAATMCLKAPDPILQDHCVRKMGTEAAWQSNGKTDRATSYCSGIFSGPPFALCITAAAEEFIFQQYPDWRDTSMVLCEALSGIEKESCLSNNNVTIRQYGR